jgi:hypothetical protein
MQAYLRAKRSVDDRALNRRVLETVTDRLAAVAEHESIRVLEVGAGVGTMPARLAAWDVLPADVEYIAIDIDETSIEVGCELLPKWLREAGYTVEEATPRDGQARFEASQEGNQLAVECRVENAFEPDPGASDGQFDCVIAPAVLDLVDLEPTLDSLETRLRPGGYLYAPITYDAGTRFTPGFDSDLDLAVEQAYHRHMDEIREGGTSRSGRRLLDVLADRGDDILAVGGSDWIVRPENGSYPGDEELVIEHVLETIGDALSEFDHGIDPERLDAWLDDRHQRRDAGALTYIAHHLDVFATLDP